MERHVAHEEEDAQHQGSCCECPVQGDVFAADGHERADETQKGGPIEAGVQHRQQVQALAGFRAEVFSRRNEKEQHDDQWHCNGGDPDEAADGFVIFQEAAHGCSVVSDGDVVKTKRVASSNN